MIHESSFNQPDPEGQQSAPEPDPELKDVPYLPRLCSEMRPTVTTEISRASLEALLDSLYSHWRNEKPLVARVSGELTCAPRTETLQGQRILLVDDIPALACLYGVELMLATHGNAAFVIHESQTQSQLAAEILAHEPNILIMDGILSGSVRGWNVIREVLSIRPELICIGFSSDPQFEQTFLDAGAVGFVHKRYELAKECTTELALVTHPFLNAG